MVDCESKPINIGDKVAFSHHRDCGVTIGIVTLISKKSITIQYTYHKNLVISVNKFGKSIYKI